MFVLDPHSGTPIYRQLVEQVQRMIAGGQLQPGEELPSVRELALQNAVNPMTISRAYAALEAEGLLLRRRGKPMTVAPRTEMAETEQERLERVQTKMEQLIAAARQLGISDAVLLAKLKQLLQANDG